MLGIDFPSDRYAPWRTRAEAWPGILETQKQAPGARGTQRAVLLGLLEVGDRLQRRPPTRCVGRNGQVGWYVGHPNGEAGWTRNLAAAFEATIAWPSGVTHRVRAERLTDGDERDAVILATAHQQPFPGNLVYRAARRHILARGAYFRLEPMDESLL